MSDLAPFVAAVLRDKSNADFMEENASLRQVIDSHSRKLRDLHAVKITGANGTPVYARANLNEDGKVKSLIYNNFRYMVAFPTMRQEDGKIQNQKQQDGPVTLCSPRDLQNPHPLEVHIGAFGDRCIETISGPFHKALYKPESQYGFWTYNANGSSALRFLNVCIGPFTSEAEYDGFDPNDAMNLPDTNSNGELLSLLVQGAVFDVNPISHLIDNFEQRRQQAQEEDAAAAAAAAAQEVARPPPHVDDNDNQ